MVRATIRKNLAAYLLNGIVNPAELLSRPAVVANERCEQRQDGRSPRTSTATAASADDALVMSTANPRGLVNTPRYTWLLGESARL